MDEVTVREQLHAVREDLERNEAEHAVLESLLKGYEGWLRLMAGNGVSASQLPMMAAVVNGKARAVNGKARTAPKGRRSMRGAVLQVLADARGESIHAKEILRRARELGANTTAKDPEAIMDLMGYSLREGHPIEKSAPRTWRWVGEKVGQKK